jgi:hypothetical protein
MFTKDGIRTLGNIIVANRMQVDLLPRFCAIQGFITSDATQAKERRY